MLSDLRITAAVSEDGTEAAAVDGLPWLFIGSLSAAEDTAWLERNVVRRILTVAPRLMVRVGPGIEHREIKVDDHPSANLLAILPEALAYIDAAAEEAAATGEQPVSRLLVHCASGVSRSVGTVVAWLIARRQLSLADALALARTARPQGHPNVGFAVQLQVLEREGGDVAAAIKAWSAQASSDALGRARERRVAANETHAAADALEEQLQRARSEGAPLGVVQAGLHALSARLDEARTGDGLPEDRVAQTVFKAARAKVERLLETVSSS